MDDNLKQTKGKSQAPYWKNGSMFNSFKMKKFSKNKRSVKFSLLLESRRMDLPDTDN